MAEVDFQMGQIKFNDGSPDVKFGGSQVVLQGNMPIDPLTVRATIASGSGDKEDATGNTGTKLEQYMNFLDKDPRYTMVYEYVMIGATGAKNQGFANTQALGIGAGYKVSKQIAIDFDAWMLTANEKVSLNGGTASDKLGTELDLKLTWTPYDQVSWYVNYGMFMTGDAYKSAAGIADNATAIQSVLSYKF
jgi:hypothetical protein